MGFEALVFLGKRPFMNNGRFVYVKLAGRVICDYPVGFESWVFGETAVCE